MLSLSSNQTDHRVGGVVSVLPHLESEAAPFEHAGLWKAHVGSFLLNISCLYYVCVHT